MSTVGIGSHCCEKMEYAVKSDDVPVSFVPKFREYGIDIIDGGTSMLQIGCCPWCGVRLPSSLRSEWFARLEELAIDPYGDQVPSRFLDDSWYSAA